ncbi:MAG: hypothetical protein QY327_00070 [Fimbriimonadaceae bacterium]|nr:hypothetical protein [Fimbriimonadaceae bacterium]MCC6351364.1 SAM-dependent DNA methyltransferase [Fimbriimonadaceae bacterium]WKZ80297.1 MAG: hypothetical protein QY327_00070 [Fimbriimonadaceae bacterium]
MLTAQIKSKQRVAQRGEVLTGGREVNAMLDLVKQETERIESRFLEPACGTGNFLVEILRRKLNEVDRRYKRSRHDWERNAVVAVSSIYGIDIDEENVEDCRDRLFVLFLEFYERRFRQRVRHECRETVRYLLGRNIIWGDARSLTQGDQPGGPPIVFAEWSPVNSSLFKRRDYAFHELFPTAATEVPADLFGEAKPKLKSDTGQNVFIPEPIREYPPVHFLEIGASHE